MPLGCRNWWTGTTAARVQVQVQVQVRGAVRAQEQVKVSALDRPVVLAVRAMLQQKGRVRVISKHSTRP